MINKIENWIDEIIKDHQSDRVSCECFADVFNGFYPVEFLSESFYVVAEPIPKPDFPELRKAGLGDFIDKPLAGITYKDTYFIQKGCESESGIFLNCKIMCMKIHHWEKWLTIFKMHSLIKGSHLIF